ncbi:MAG: hypothetical protein KKB82_09270 [Candidatus Omnitrophica bacterium]|nr:hypothetical protein [Candidatus Omnitrophota bacterium]MBU1926094.1 hypothetical protein [Candidatus Omnitrophota bacterium]
MKKVLGFYYRLFFPSLIGLLLITANPVASFAFYADRTGIESATLSPKLYLQQLLPAFISSFLDTKSIASVPEEDIHEAINLAIKQGEAVAFDITKDISYYFGETLSLEQSAQRLQEAVLGVNNSGRQNLLGRLNDKKLLNRLRWSFMRIKKAVETSAHNATLRQRRYLVMFADHPAFNTADILEHAGTQQKTSQYGIATIFIPLPFLNFIDEIGADNIAFAFRCVLEHADFHLRGNPRAVIIENHAYSSKDEYELIRSLRQGFMLYQKLLFSESAKDITLGEAFSRIRTLSHMGEISYIQLESEDSSTGIGTSGTFFRITPATADKTLGLVRGVLVSLNASKKYDFSIKGIDIITQDSQMNVPAVFLKYKVDEQAKVIDILAPLDRKNARQVLDAYHNLSLSGHNKILEIARGEILTVNSLIKERLDTIPEDVSYIMEVTLLSVEMAQVLPAIPYKSLVSLRSMIRQYVAVVDELKLKFPDSARQQRLAEELDSLEFAQATALYELVPTKMSIELFPRFNQERKRKACRIIGVIGEGGTLYTHSVKPKVFKAVAGTEEIQVDLEDLQGFIKKIIVSNGKLLVVDTSVPEENISPEDVMQFPSRTQAEVEWFLSKTSSRSGPQNLAITNLIEQAI